MKLSEKDLEQLTEFRKELHTNPELSGEEYETAKRIIARLKDCQPTHIIDGLGKTGIVAEFDSGVEGPAILFRAELDALPIQEINDFAYRSQTEGVSHKCGHDGHSTIMLGLAKLLQLNPVKKGKVLLLFQPAEENGEGAISVMQDERFRALDPDLVFALHNLPGYPLHKIVVRENAFTAAVKSVVISFHGKTSHAAEPENGINPSAAMAELLLLADNISNNDPEREDFKLITPVHLNMGEVAYGISAGYGEIHLTIRTWTDDYMGELEKELITMMNEISIKHSIKLSHYFTHEFSANENESSAVEQVVSAAEKLGLSVEYRDYPFKWGEDFGLFTQHYKGAMFGLGSGEDTPSLHNPDYDFPDSLIYTGAHLFHEICKWYCY